MVQGKVRLLPCPLILKLDTMKRVRIKSVEERIAQKYKELHGGTLADGFRHVAFVEMRSNLRYITDPSLLGTADPNSL